MSLGKVRVLMMEVLCCFSLLSINVMILIEFTMCVRPAVRPRDYSENFRNFPRLLFY